MLLSSVEVGVKEDIAIQRVMGSVDGILWAMSCADMMLSRALQLYHTRGAARLAIDLFGPLSTILLRSHRVMSSRATASTRQADFASEPAAHQLLAQLQFVRNPRASGSPRLAGVRGQTAAGVA